MIKLNKFNITYQPRNAIKAQILIDFLIECTWQDDKLEELVVLVNSELAWILHVDEASNFQETRDGLILANLEGIVAEYMLHFLLKVINN